MATQGSKPTKRQIQAARRWLALNKTQVVLHYLYQQWGLPTKFARLK